MAITIKTIKVTAESRYFNGKTVIRAKLNTTEKGVRYIAISARQIKSAQCRIGMKGGDYLMLIAADGFGEFHRTEDGSYAAYNIEDAARVTAAEAEAARVAAEAKALADTAESRAASPKFMTFADISEILLKAGFAEAAEAAEKLHALNPAAMPVQIGRGLQFPHPQTMNDAIYSRTGRNRPQQYAAAMADARIVRAALCDVRDGVAPEAS